MSHYGTVLLMLVGVVGFHGFPSDCSYALDSFTFRLLTKLEAELDHGEDRHPASEHRARRFEGRFEAS